MRKKAHIEEAHANSERWLLTYADLITLLLVFFVVMYSMSKADQAKFNKVSASLQKAFGGLVLQGDDKTALASDSGAAGGNSIMEDLLGMRAEIARLNGDMGLQNQVKVGLEKDGIAITLAGSLLFDSGRAELRPEALRALDSVADVVRNMPNNIRVEGHTDNIPVESEIYPTNWELSVARATAVTRYLAEIDRVPAQRLSAMGYGEFKPIADNDSRDTRAMNRRVEVLIVYDN